jgi:hypothetical protein
VINNFAGKITLSLAMFMFTDNRLVDANNIFFKFLFPVQSIFTIYHYFTKIGSKQPLETQPVLVIAPDTGVIANAWLPDLERSLENVTVSHALSKEVSNLSIF